MEKIALSLSPATMQAINDGLMLLAYGKAAPAVAEINECLRAQQPAPLGEHATPVPPLHALK